MKEACCVCYDPEFDSLIYESKFTLERLSGEIVKSLYYGFNCDSRAESKMDLLQNYLAVLEDEYRKIALGGMPCLDCYDLQSLAEKVRKITTNCDLMGRKDFILDESNLDAWIAQNPQCVSREKWERISYTVCKAFDLQIEVVPYDCDITVEAISIEQLCDLTFEIVRSVIPCDLILAISVYQEMCDLSFEITRTREECKLDFDILVSETNCNLDFKTYLKLVDCNLSFDIIRTAYDNGCTFTIEQGAPMLETTINKYPLSKLKFQGDIDIKKLTKLGIDLENSEFIKDPDAFINKLKQDYDK